MKFASRRAAGDALALLLADNGPWPDALVLALGARGREVAEPVVHVLHADLSVIEIDVGGDHPLVGPMPDVRERLVIVVSDGVETGAAAHAVAQRLDDAARTVLAVGVCPRDALATLQFAYDDVFAVQRPMGRRALTWHYADS